jgi:PD-(D/E)XK nuclease superfamily protein
VTKLLRVSRPRNGSGDSIPRVENESRIVGLPAPPERSHHPVDVGVCTEAVILAELVKRGYRVLVPYGPNHRYDLAIDTGDCFIRLQCKTGRMRHGSVNFSTCSVRSNTKKAVTRRYDGEIEFFAVYCRDNERVYMVPVEETRSRGQALRVDPPLNNQVRRIRWAADYELPA